MNLRTLAHNDLIEILKDPTGGGWPATVTPPTGSPVDFTVYANDIHLTIDPGSGQLVSGREASIAVLISDLIAAGFENIGGVADSTQKPWIVDTTDVNGRPFKFKVVESYPDNGAGLLVLFLEVYKTT